MMFNCDRVVCLFVALVICLSMGSPAGAQNLVAASGPESTAVTQAASGPHGGKLQRGAGVLWELVAADSGIRVFALSEDREPIEITTGRGIVVLQLDEHAKRYRYDLLPDGNGAFVARVNLSKVLGHSLKLQVRLVGLPVGQGDAAFETLLPVAPDLKKLAADAIARQQVCPVSGKPLGSMGTPIVVDIGDNQLYVCCAGCVDAVKANPESYLSGRPKIQVTSATDEDAALIAQQKTCPVMDEPLGSMGQPVKVMVGDKPVFLCCRGCVSKIEAEPMKFVNRVYGSSDATVEVASGETQVRPGVFKVTEADAPFIAAQRTCPVMEEPLDAMGGPYKVHAGGRAIYICCPGCAKSIAAKPAEYLAKLKQEGVDVPVLR